MAKRKIKQRGKPKAKQAAKVVAKKISKAPVRKTRVTEKAKVDIFVTQKAIVTETKVVKVGPKKAAKVSKAAKKTQLKKKVAAKKKQVKKEEAKAKVVVVEKKKFERPKKVAKKPILEEHDTDGDEEESPPLGPAPVKKAAKPTNKWSYTPEQKQIYQDTLKKYGSDNLIIIKKLLQKNGQSMSGNKSEVLEKLADGFALGAIPRCPHCFGGRPKFNKSNGTYKCPGFRDDVDYKFCNKTFTFTEITREKWIE